jgi:hypothetical protein
MKHKYRLNVGIGDIIVCKSQLLQIDTDQIIISPNLRVAENYRAKSYQEFATNFLKTIYTEPVFKITTTQDNTYQRAFWGFFAEQGLKPQWISLEKQLCVGEPLDFNDYVVVNMKVRGLNHKLFKSFLPEFRKTLQAVKKKHKLVFIGERQVGMCMEYRNLAAIGYLTFSLYKHIKDLVDVDLTIPELGITSPKMEDLKQKCVYMRDATAVINLGHGGNVSLSGSISKRTFNLFANTTSVGSLYFMGSNKNHPVYQKFNEFDRDVRAALGG